MRPPEWRFQLSQAQTPGHGEFEIIDLLPLRLSQYCHTAMEDEYKQFQYIILFLEQYRDLCLSQCLQIMKLISESLNTLPVFIH